MDIYAHITTQSVKKTGDRFAKFTGKQLIPNVSNHGCPNKKTPRINVIYYNVNLSIY